MRKINSIHKSHCNAGGVVCGWTCRMTFFPPTNKLLYFSWRREKKLLLISSFNWKMPQQPPTECCGLYLNFTLDKNDRILQRERISRVWQAINFPNLDFRGTRWCGKNIFLSKSSREKVGTFFFNLGDIKNLTAFRGIQRVRGSMRYDQTCVIFLDLMMWHKSCYSCSLK